MVIKLCIFLFPINKSAECRELLLTVISVSPCFRASVQKPGSNLVPEAYYIVLPGEDI